MDVIDTDRFMDMPISAQALYFHLGMHGDDDGFVSSPKRIVRAVGSCDDDLRLLAAKDFIKPFKSGVIVITDWAKNNTLRNDRYRPTVYAEEKAQLKQNETGRYYFTNTDGCQMVYQMDASGCPMVCQMDTQHNLTEHNLTKPNLDIDNALPQALPKPHEKSRKFVPPTVEEVAQYVAERGSNVDPQGFVDFYASKGWKVGRNDMKDWKAACRNAENWERWKTNPMAKKASRNDIDLNDILGGNK